MTSPAPSSASANLHTLYSDHHGWLSGWLRHKLGNRFDAADLAHDTFLRVMRASNAQDIREPRQYLATIAGGLVIDLYRRRSIEQHYLELLATRPEATSPSPETRALIIETLLEIDAMLSGLGTRIRRAFLLSQCDGLTYAQIAAELGVSVRTVNKYMAIAMEHCCLYRLQNP